jgi:hypothetical protein
VVQLGCARILILFLRLVTQHIFLTPILQFHRAVNMTGGLRMNARILTTTMDFATPKASFIRSWPIDAGLVSCIYYVALFCSEAFCLNIYLSFNLNSGQCDGNPGSTCSCTQMVSNSDPAYTADCTTSEACNPGVCNGVCLFPLLDCEFHSLLLFVDSSFINLMLL